MIRVPTEQETADHYGKAKNEGGSKPDDLVRAGVAPAELVKAARAELASHSMLADLLNISEHRGMLKVMDLGLLPPNLRDLAHWALDSFATRRGAKASLFSQLPGTELRAHSDAVQGPDRALSIGLEPGSGAHFSVGGNEADHHECGTGVMMLPGEVWSWRRRSRHSARNDSTELRVVMILEFDPTAIIAPEPGKTGLVWIVGEDDRGNEARIYLGTPKVAMGMLADWLLSYRPQLLDRLRCGRKCLRDQASTPPLDVAFMQSSAISDRIDEG